MPSIDDERDRALFTHSFVVWRARLIPCDPRSYLRELTEPGSVRGQVAIRIRLDIAMQRRLHGESRVARRDAYRDIVAANRFEARGASRKARA